MNDNKNVLVSIILPVYNRYQYLKQAIESVLNQTYSNWELLIADNASNEETKNYINSLNLSLDYRIKIFRNETNLGLFGNLNRNINKAQGAYVVFLCDDDCLLPDCLQICLDHSQQFPSANLFLFGRYTINKEGSIIHQKTNAYYQKMCNGSSKIFSPSESLPLLLRYGSYNGNITRMFFKKELFNNIGEFKENLKQVGDWEWLYRACRQGNIFVSTTPVASVRHHEEQLSAQNWKDLTNSMEVITMISLLLKDPTIQEWKEANKWASYQLQFQLWNAIKLIFQGNLNNSLKLIKELAKVMDLKKVIWSLIKYLPRRYKVYFNKNELELI